MITRITSCWVFLACAFAGLATGIPAAAQSTAVKWTWKFLESRVPNFEGEEEQNNQTLMVGIQFRNQRPTEQIIILSPDKFRAIVDDGHETSIVALLFALKGRTGAKSISFTTQKDNNDPTIKPKHFVDQRNGARVTYVRALGNVKIVVSGNRSFVQGLLIRKPKRAGGLKLRFDDLPDLRLNAPK